MVNNLIAHPCAISNSDAKLLLHTITTGSTKAAGMQVFAEKSILFRSEKFLQHIAFLLSGRPQPY
jgi:hypothetical protein